MRLLSPFLIGLVFGLGIVISGMVNPAKVLNFFDIAGSWDPSLAFVMGGALITTFVGYRFVLSRPGPILGDSFQLPGSARIDVRLISGAAIFGIGWGIAGFCPGGAIPALGTGKSEVLIFIAALIVGLVGTRLIISRWWSPKATPTSSQQAQA